MGFRLAITPARRAAHVLFVKAPALAAAAVEQLYREQPDLHARHGPAGKAHCAKDVAYHVRFLSAAVEMNDPKVFTDYVAWAVGVLASRGIPPADAAASLRALRDVAGGAADEPHASFVRGTITAALQHADSADARVRPRPPRHRPRAQRYAAADASVDGSTPSHF
jgi:hypothetical protein